MAQKKLKFEDGITRLDEIVKCLEKGEVSLDESLSLFEEGTRLIKSCGKQLDEAEQKVTRLMKGADGEPVEADFAPQE